ncbi:unnamed protein product [Phytophthora fragariaefolia]|uniref:Unnamed protein product n=1 Tax=Phytophthora fragariaefolia TaxID=1490495 RepID=A0A9W6XDT0_9STRA|nr:unnamed protein product [Phytophthora fragariaefolia]
MNRLTHDDSVLEELCTTLVQEMKVSKATVQSQLARLKEANAVMGIRGHRTPGHHGDASKGHRRGGREGGERGHLDGPAYHDPAGGLVRGAGEPGEAGYEGGAVRDRHAASRSTTRWAR